MTPPHQSAEPPPPWAKYLPPFLVLAIILCGCPPKPFAPDVPDMAADAHNAYTTRGSVRRAFRMEDGQELWNASSEREKYGHNAILTLDKYLYLLQTRGDMADKDPRVVALDPASGKEVRHWNHAPFAAGEGYLVLTDGTIVRTDQARTVGHLWFSFRDAQEAQKRSAGGPEIRAGRLTATFKSGKYAAVRQFDLATRRQRWSFDLLGDIGWISGHTVRFQATAGDLVVLVTNFGDTDTAIGCDPIQKKCLWEYTATGMNELLDLPRPARPGELLPVDLRTRVLDPRTGQLVTRTPDPAVARLREAFQEEARFYRHGDAILVMRRTSGQPRTGREISEPGEFTLACYEAASGQRRWEHGGESLVLPLSERMRWVPWPRLFANDKTVALLRFSALSPHGFPLFLDLATGQPRPTPAR